MLLFSITFTLITLYEINIFPDPPAEQAPDIPNVYEEVEEPQAANNPSDAPYDMIGIWIFF